MSELPTTDLLSVAQALAIIDAIPVTPRIVPLPLPQAEGHRLAQQLRADRDYPPFDRSLMDGYAIRCADITPTAVWRVVGQIAAGQMPASELHAGESVAIMTGAPLPQGADGVVPIEHTQRDADTMRLIQAGDPSRYLSRRGAECRAGQVVLSPPTLLQAPQLALAATIGASQLLVYDRPRVALLATGDELVDIAQTPGPAQIRNSNSPMLLALLQQLGCQVTDLGRAVDDPDQLRAALQQGLTFDALLVTGGMSMGQYDYVPRLLRELGVELKITKLRIKPGKPFVFGVGRREGTGFGVQGSGKEPSLLNPEPRTLNPSMVFGLPGNPVSAFVCTLRLASRLLTRLGGGQPPTELRRAPLQSALGKNGPREFYQPAQLDASGLHPLQWNGSADVFTLAQANALLLRKENEPDLPPGTMVPVIPFAEVGP